MMPLLRRWAVVLSLLLTLYPEVVAAQASAVARAVSVQGSVEARRAGQQQWVAVKLNDSFAPGDTIRVGDRSRADLALLNQSVLRVNAGTEMVIEPVKDQTTGVVNLLRGATHFLSRGPRSLEVQTPFTTAGVRGTEFFIALEPNRTLLTVFEGTVVAANQAGSLTLTSGQSAEAEAGKAPVTRVVARPRDAVHWALYYPPVLYFRPDEVPSGPARQSLDAYRAGDLKTALDAVNAVPAGADARFFAHRAHLLLAVGRVDEAAADIGRALSAAPNDSNALALQTIIAVVQGDKDRAFDTAQRAVQADPKSATARIALSYAQQARFDLEGARANLREAVRLDPRNALAWARLSELEASFGQLNRALDAAQKAAALEPNLSRTQTVLGYAHLMRVNTKRAKEAFEKAIALDSADPLPRLGLGLAKIREGGVDEGSRELEAAASLDPSNAIVRSYLGKAYYEEKRTGLDEREYAVAKQLDPNDPTPWFYDAIAKQTTNRPVEALRSLERAIELNDNRAVYRSRLLLDEDLAARSASLARIYSDLGFQQLALVEGWKSVNTDPTSFSAHRFLADSYAVRSRHEIARVSELLQSQLLQPLNVTPIQPRLAESNLFLISALGPATLSFNEFNPIFNRDRLAFQTTGLYGENDTWAVEGLISGIYRKASFSVGYTHFETDGFRVNAFQKDDIFNAFVQFELTPQTSVQAEYRHRETETGDLLLRFFRDDFFRGQTTIEDRDSIRIGARHAFSPESILLASVSYSSADTHQRIEPFPQVGVRFADFDLPKEEAFGVELQHLFRSRYVNLRTGAGYVDIDGALETTVGFGPPRVPFNINVESVTKTQIGHFNVYEYADIKPLRNLMFTLGLSFDSLSGDFPGDDTETNQFNPKIGVIWNPLPDTTLRAAVFRTLKRTLISNQTLEPTQVAGFNQFFDDLNLSDIWRYGVAADQKFTKSLFGGLELSKRDLTVPFLNFVANPAGPPTDHTDWHEYSARTYAFWTPHDWIALRAEYIFERLSRDKEFPAGVREADTHKVPLGISFFHPSGWSTSLTSTYYHQEGKFGGFHAQSPIRNGRDDFWVTDAAINYRLPKRYGFVTLGVTNLFEENFKYFDPDLRNASIQPTRMVFGKVTLALP
jgi:tetratricopeptide (TPR) repeat protein